MSTFSEDLNNAAKAWSPVINGLNALDTEFTWDMSTTGGGCLAIEGSSSEYSILVTTLDPLAATPGNWDDQVDKMIVVGLYNCDPDSDCNALMYVSAIRPRHLVSWPFTVVRLIDAMRPTTNALPDQLNSQMGL